MIDLHPVIKNPALLRQRLIMAEILARRGQGPLALGSYVSLRRPPIPSFIPARATHNESIQDRTDG